MAFFNKTKKVKGQLSKVCILAGGTGGHVFPGLAVAQALLDDGVKVYWLGTASGIEAKLVPDAGIDIGFIKISGLRSKGIIRLLLAPFRIMYALMQSLIKLWHFKPDVVIGMGGYATGPAGLAAFLLRYPLVLHEQNSVAGLTNRILACVATAVCTGFPDVFKQGAYIGNPVRSTLVALPEPETRLKNRTDNVRILILGGSQGALAINELMPHVVAAIDDEIRPLVWHQAGAKHFASCKSCYDYLHVVANVEPFIDDMKAAYEWADLVIARAGALTIAELTAVGLGAILVPYPHAVDNHQLKNAEYLANNKAAIIVPQEKFNKDNMLQELGELIYHRERLVEMAYCSYAVRQVDAAQKLIDIIGRSIFIINNKVGVLL